MTNNLNPVHNKFNVVECLIDVSEDNDLSEAVNLGGRWLLGLEIPASWTAADITFMASMDGATYKALVDETGAAVGVTVTADTIVGFSGINPAVFLAARFLKIATSAGQAADRTLKFLLADPN